MIDPLRDLQRSYKKEVTKLCFLSHAVLISKSSTEQRDAQFKTVSKIQNDLRKANVAKRLADYKTIEQACEDAAKDWHIRWLSSASKIKRIIASIFLTVQKSPPKYIGKRIEFLLERTHEI